MPNQVTLRIAIGDASLTHVIKLAAHSTNARQRLLRWMVQSFIMTLYEPLALHLFTL
jgi:hypothetical protein